MTLDQRLCCWFVPVGAYTGKCVIVVDDDIVVSNMDELLRALCTRSDPASSIDIIKTAWSTPLDPRSVRSALPKSVRSA